MKFFLFRMFSFSLVLASAGSASTLTGNISGTCGFYQGTVSNVVFSQPFSGDGTFCTGFLSGGSFTDSGILQVGDVFSLAHNTISAAAPAGYGVFVNISTTFQVTQNYLLSSPVPVNTTTGVLKTYLSGQGTTDDGSGLGSCSEHASVNLAGFSAPSGSQIGIPITFGQTISAVETATVTCADYGPVSRGFGDDGVQEVSAGPLLLYDANGNILGPAILTTLTPEPATGPLMFLAGLPLLGLFYRKQVNPTRCDHQAEEANGALPR